MDKTIKSLVMGTMDKLYSPLTEYTLPDRTETFLIKDSKVQFEINKDYIFVNYSILESFDHLLGLPFRESSFHIKQWLMLKHETIVSKYQTIVESTPYNNETIMYCMLREHWTDIESELEN